MRVEVIIVVAIALILIGLIAATNVLQNDTNDSQNIEGFDMPINNDTHPGIVTLNVQDISLLREFYTQTLLFDIISEDNSSVILGKEGHKIIRLQSRPKLPFPKPGDAGLYHVAIVYNSRSELARTVKNALETNPNYFAGSANHNVSEAFYFSDPEGNGIELYFDVDKSRWIWKNGTIEMDTKSLDVINYIKKYLDTGGDKIAMTRHVHLKAGNIADAKEFYVKKLGFTITSEMSSAVFVSAGGYHHHIALNIWESEGAGPRGETLGLDNYELIVPKTYVGTMESRLKHYNITYKNVNGTLQFSDPWNNNIHIVGE